MPKAPAHKWTFKARFRRHAFGWRSQPAIKRVKEAVSEIKKEARKQPILAAEGAVAFLERLSPAIEQVDGSSGAIGSAVNKAIDQLVPIIAKADVGAATRRKWLDRLFEAYMDDGIPYIEALGDRWGELCVDPDIASDQADELMDPTRRVLLTHREGRAFFKGSSVCLSALFTAQRYDEILELTQVEDFWHYKSWAVKALVAQGKKAAAIRLAESCRSSWTPDLEVDRICEEVLLSSGMADEAYRRYGLTAHRKGTHLATFRAVAKRYPDKAKEEILDDLVKASEVEPGKWFAAAKSAGLYDKALELVESSPCDPKTLTRAARDFAEKKPHFAVGAGLAAMHWLLQGQYYEIMSSDVRQAFDETMRAATAADVVAETEAKVREMVERDKGDRFVRPILRGCLGLS